jgi:hypothetical protein
MTDIGKKDVKQLGQAMDRNAASFCLQASWLHGGIIGKRQAPRPRREKGFRKSGSRQVRINSIRTILRTLLGNQV